MGHPNTERAPPRAPGVHRRAPGWGPSPPITPCAVHARGARCTLHPAAPLRGRNRVVQGGNARSRDPSLDPSGRTQAFDESVTEEPGLVSREVDAAAIPRPLLGRDDAFIVRADRREPLVVLRLSLAEIAKRTV
jgi:hypothetical protein